MESHSFISLFQTLEHEISLIGGTVALGPLGGGAEIVVNIGQLSDAAHSFLPAVGQGFQYLLGLTGGGSQDGQGGGWERN